MSKAILFDLDGVIVSTDAFHYKAWKTIADEMEIPFGEDINNRLRGISRMESLEIILEGHPTTLPTEQKQQLAQKKNGIYQTMLQQLGPADVAQEVTDTLATLRKRGYALAIASSSKNALLILERIGLGNYFDAVSDGNNITQSKPHPEVFLKAADYLNLPHSDCCVVEDAVAGVQAGQAAGMVTYAVGDASLQKAAHYNLQFFSQLLNTLTGVK